MNKFIRSRSELESSHIFHGYYRYRHHQESIEHIFYKYELAKSFWNRFRLFAIQHLGLRDYEFSRITLGCNLFFPWISNDTMWRASCTFCNIIKFNLDFLVKSFICIYWYHDYFSMTTWNEDVILSASNVSMNLIRKKLDSPLCSSDHFMNTLCTNNIISMTDCGLKLRSQY